MIVSEDGRTTRIAKVATDPESHGPLDREAESIVRLGRMLAPPIHAPTIAAHEPGLLILEGEPWLPRTRPWFVGETVARAMGSFFAAGSSDLAQGPAHGDFAPWNLLRTEGGWLLIDWEFAAMDAPPFYDLFHHLVQGLVLLGRPALHELLSGLRRGDNWVGSAIRAYAVGAGITPSDPSSFFRRYLELSRERMLVEPHPPLRAIRTRDAMLRELDG
jgi:hypothetical protein